MEKKEEAKPGDPLEKRVRFPRKDILVFAFFLLLSFIFWYLNSLEKDLEAEIRYPVAITNVPGNRILSGEKPERLILNIKGPGYSILRLRIMGNSSPLSVDLSKVAYRHLPGAKSTEYYIVSSGLVQGLNSQLKASCRISSVRPDTLFFSLAQAQR